MSDDNKTGSEYLFEITAFLVASAKRCMGPEAAYGPARLIQTMNLLSHLPEYAPELEGNTLLRAAQEFVNGDPNWGRDEKLRPFVDQLSHKLLDEMRSKLALQ
ncbi:MAG TPA: hypothetical protein PKO09_17620 [Anaerolineae bacterium]|nr:hypothetical protein [Anaerolineae bacterium]